MGVIRRNFKTCPVQFKSQLYKSLILPKLMYGSAAWYPSTKDEKHLDMIQRSAARLCFNNYSRKASVIEMLHRLDWPSLEVNRLVVRLSLMYRISHNLVDIKWEDHLNKPSRNTRRHHRLSYIQIAAKSSTYANSFFPWTIPHWSSLPHNILSIDKYDLFNSALRIHFR